MLVLTRLKGEAIVLPDCGVELVVLDVIGRKVRLGIMAPQTVKVHRKEVWGKIQEEKRQAEAELAKDSKPG